MYVNINVSSTLNAANSDENHETKVGEEIVDYFEPLAEDFEENSHELQQHLADLEQQQYLRQITEYSFDRLMQHHYHLVPFLTLEALHTFLFDQDYHLS